MGLENEFYITWIFVGLCGCLLQCDTFYTLLVGQLIEGQIYKCVSAPKDRESNLRIEKCLN